MKFYFPLLLQSRQPKKFYMQKKFILLVSLMFAFYISQAQNYAIKGVTMNTETSKAIPGATITLKSKSDTTIVQKVISDTAGRFSITGVASDTFNLEVTAVNFSSIINKVIVSNADVNLGDIELRQISEVLKGVTVTTNISPVTQKGDTLQINANNFKVNPDATIEDLAKKMPGITIENGVVKAQGEDVKRVTLDGRELFGDDATAALRNLPAEIVDKIQIFDRLSDQAQFTGVDDGNTTKGLNIITKANMRNGQYGRAYAGAGTDGRYTAGGNTTILKENQKISVVGNFNNINQQNFSAQDLLGVTSSGGGRGGGRGGRGPGGGGGNNGNFTVGQQNGINKTNAAGINYTDNWGSKMVVTGSYFFNNTNNSTNQFVNRQYSLKGLQSYNQNTLSGSNNYSNRVNLRIEYKIDSANQIIFSPNLSFQKNSNNQSVSTNFVDPTSKGTTSATKNNNLSDRLGNSINSSLLYRHSFGKRGRTFSVNLSSSSNNRTGNVYTDLFDTTFVGATYRDSTSRRFTDQSNDGYNLSANIIYTEPVSKQSQIQISYNPNYGRSNADQEAFQYDKDAGKYTIFDQSLSSRFKNTNTGQNGGLTYRFGSKDNQFSFGANYQYSTLKSDQEYPRPLMVSKSFSNVLPSAFLRLKIDDKSNVRIFYRMSTNLPSVTQLQDVYDYTNIPFVTAGNPQLEQQLSQIVGTRYTFTNSKKGILTSANLFLQTASNYITNATFIAVRDSVLNNNLTLKSGQQLTKPVNLNGYISVRSFLNFAVPLKFIKSNLNLNGGVSYSRLPGIINNIENISKSSTYSLGAVVASNVSQYVDFTVSYSANFNTAVNETQPQLNNNYFSQVGSVSLNLLSKKGWFFQNELNNQLYNGLTAGFNQSYYLWNMSAGKKIFKKKSGEIKFTVFDLLKQNQSITRNITETYIEDVQNQVLQQYFLLTFTYSLRNFGSIPSRPQGPGGGGDRGSFRRF